MRIGIDFHSAEREGSGNCTYIRNLVEALLQIDRENEYYLYVTDRKYPYYEKFSGIANVKFCLTRSHNPFIRIPWLGIRTFFDKIDLLHVQYIAPPFHRGKLVVTIHDLSFLRFPECFRPLERFRLKKLIPRDIKKADKILTISQYSRRDIMDSYHLTTGKVVVTYPGTNQIFQTREYGKEGKEILEHYGILDKYILFVGRINARKNVSALIEAFFLLKQEKNFPHKLVIVGKKDFLPGEVGRKLASARQSKDVIFTGFVLEDHLPLIYSSAEVFVYPSRYEGFGLPCLEAMACGCPVVSVNISSIPEVVGDAGLLIQNWNEKELADTVYRIISDSVLREELRAKGFRQAKLFTWEETARKTLEVYQRVGLNFSRYKKNEDM